jgi:hypothetical protein
VVIKKRGRDIQLSFDFDNGKREIKFISVRGQCICGYAGDFKKADVVLEMTVLCPSCGSVIKIK